MEQEYRYTSRRTDLVQSRDVIFRKLFSILLLESNVVELDLFQKSGREIVALSQLGYPGLMFELKAIVIILC